MLKTVLFSFSVYLTLETCVKTRIFGRTRKLLGQYTIRFILQYNHKFYFLSVWQVLIAHSANNIYVEVKLKSLSALTHTRGRIGDKEEETSIRIMLHNENTDQ
ncbi:MAG: hypothetical protein CW691_05370 [Candidatus Bathyarchaeum sp.]|nr:MAG: hypothetical protein CW691_05370 [Candidatus Bathyarchaeum sp.]